MIDRPKYLTILALVAQGFHAYGGIAQSTRDFLMSANRILPTATIRVLTRTGETHRIYNRHGIYQLPPLPSRIKFCLATIRETLRQKIGLIYCGHLFMAPLAMYVARMTRAPLLIHLHGLELKAPRTHARIKSLRSANMIVCVSKDTADLVTNYAGISTDQTVTLPNTVRNIFRVPSDRSHARHKFDLGNRFTLLTVSRLDTRQRHKGHERVISTLPALLRIKPDLVYLICGDGDDKPRLEELARREGVADYVRFLGRISDNDLPELYGAADLYVMPSTDDGFGIAFIEAMACGTPALGLAVGGALDALCPEELGYACPPDAFEETLVKLTHKITGHDMLARKTLSAATYGKFGKVAYDKRVYDIMSALRL